MMKGGHARSLSVIAEFDQNALNCTWPSVQKSSVLP